MMIPLFLSMLALAAAAAAGPAPAAPVPAREIYRSDDLDLIVRTQTLKLPRIDALIRGLELKPGMTILDIGAGSGQQSYKLAEALKGTGKVYAADINPRLVDYVASEARRRGLANLKAMLVSPEGVDPSYAARSYDLILMYDVYNYLSDRVAYYAALRAFLKPGGRVVLVESEPVPDRSFYPEDIRDWPGLLKALKDDPLAKGPAGPDARRSALFHLNRALDQKLYLRFSDGGELAPDVGLTDAERPYAAWLLRRLTLDEVSKRDLIRTELQLFRLMQSLNKLILIARYRPYLTGEGEHPYWSSGPEVRWYREHDRFVSELAAAGYALERREPLAPYQAVWTFKAAP